MKSEWPRRSVSWLSTVHLLTCALIATAADEPSGRGEEPRIVLQLGHQAPVRAALWTADSRHLFSLAEDGSIVVWDVNRDAPGGVIIDRATVPWQRGARVLAFVANPDGKTARITLKIDPSCRERAIGRWSDGRQGGCSNHIDPASGDAAVYDLDLETRAVVPQPVTEGTLDTTLLFPVSPDGRWGVVQNRGSGENGIFDPQDENILFNEPGCSSRARCRYGVNLFRADQLPNGRRAPTTGVAGCFSRQVKVMLPGGVESTGSELACFQPEPVIRLTGSPRSYFLDMDLSRDGRRLLRLESLLNDSAARVQLLDVNDSSASSEFLPDAALHRIEWLDSERYMLYSHGFDASNDMVSGGIPAAMRVTTECSRGDAASCLRIEPHAMMRPLGNGETFVGAGSIEGCFRATFGGADRGPESLERGPDEVWCVSDEEQAGDNGFVQWRELQILGPDSRGAASWKVRAVQQLAGLSLTAIEVAPDGHRIAVAARSTAPGSRAVVIVLLDASPAIPAREIWRGSDPAGEDDGGAGTPEIRYMAFDPEGRQLLFNFHGVLTVVDIAGAGSPRQIPMDRSRRLETDGQHAFILSSGALIDLQTGNQLALPTRDLLKAGFLEGKPVLWTATTDGVVQFWHAQSGASLLTLYSFNENRFFAVTPEGRYDTNLTPDANEVRWLMADTPWQSLAAQTFMRDYYEPRLVSRLLSCTTADRCAKEFRALPPVHQLNRTLPHVQISSVMPGTAEGTVDVCVAARSTTSGSANGHERSGLHDLRLFRDGRLVAERGAPPGDMDPADHDRWLAATALSEQTCPDPASVFTVAVPLGGDQPVTFTAYALNSSRVKGDTSQPVTYRPPARRTPRTPRAYVIAIGVNDYVHIPEKSLRFAVNDAHAVTAALKSIPGHDVVSVELTSGSGRNLATKALIHAALRVLAGKIDADTAREQLRSAGVDASGLEPATPDDVVIITFSGHGVTDSLGRFFLVPSDANWSGDNAQSDRGTMISSGELTEWLRDVDAADIAMVIDACHSAASVAAGEFKPGPMGDPGLGQLAYDKGIRILAATQGDDVALEDERLRQGLLTFALTGRGEALDQDRRVTLETWLRYAARRLPSLATDERVNVQRTRGFTLLGNSKPQVQEPSLFDFTGQASRVVLKERSGPGGVP